MSVVRDKFPVVKDILERTVATFVVTVLGLATADGVDLQNALDLSNWKTWATAGVIAAFTLVKGIIASRVNGPGASLAPGVELQRESATAMGTETNSSI
jgi:methyl coenzyme M reductase beta subunit